MEKRKTNERGITLISLVITIILLLILATVAISLAVDSDGLFRKAGDAANTWNTAVADEETQLSNLMEYLNKEPAKTEEELKAILAEQTGDSAIDDKGNIVDISLWRYRTTGADTCEIYGVYSQYDGTAIAYKEELDNAGRTQGNIPAYIKVGDEIYKMTAIGERAFDGCTGLTSITIPNSVTSIDYIAFASCTGLTSITIPSSVTSIDSSAFASCTGLTSITIPSSVTSIGQNAFASCTGLTSIIVDKNNTVYDSKNNCNAIIETSTNELILGCKNTTIPSGVTSIGQNAFSNCTGLTSITIPNSVTSIDSSAFASCSGLTSITIPNSVTSINSSAFASCSGLTSIIVDKNNTVYDSRNNCNAIIETSTNVLVLGCKSTTIPSGVTGIGHGAFDGCTGLTSITIPNSVTYIDYNAFYGCTGLTSITIPNSVTDIAYNAFTSCPGLINIKMNVTENSVSRAPWGATNATVEWLEEAG